MCSIPCGLLVCFVAARQHSVELGETSWLANGTTLPSASNGRRASSVLQLDELAAEHIDTYMGGQIEPAQ